MKRVLVVRVVAGRIGGVVGVLRGRLEELTKLHLFLNAGLINDEALWLDFHSLLSGFFVYTSESYSILEKLLSTQRLPSDRRILPKNCRTL